MRLLLSRTRAEVFVFLLFLFAGSYFHYSVEYDNTWSRFFAVSAAVDFGLSHIDPYAPLTSDKSWGQGHSYSNKAIGASLLGIPVYWALRNIGPWSDSPALSKGLRYGVRLITTTLLFAIVGVILFRSTRSLGVPPLRSLLATCSFGFGSIAFIHSGLFSGHDIAAAFSYFSFAGLTLLKRHNGRISGFLLGLSSGIAALADYTAALISCVLLVYAFLSPIGRRNKIGFLMGGLICASFLGAYNWKCFGSPFSFSYAHQVTEAFAAGSRQGFLGIGLSDWRAVLSLLVSPSRGLFFIMPVFLFSISGIWGMVKNPELRAEGVVVLLITLGYVLMIGGFYGWHGGWTFGPRYFVPMLPFLAFVMPFARWDPAPITLCMIVSILQVQVAAISFPHCPEAIQNPLPELIVPLMLNGYAAETWPGWLGLSYPWAVFLYVGACGLLVTSAWISARKASSPGQRDHLRFGRWAVYLWLAYIGVMFATLRTDPPDLVQAYRERLRFHLENEAVFEGFVQKLFHSYKLLMEPYGAAHSPKPDGLSDEPHGR